jgi:hypothetical protein
LSHREQQAVLRRLIKDQKLRQVLMDLALIEERQTEPERPLRDFLNELDQ